MNRLKTINESLGFKGPMKGVYGSVGINISVDQESNKVNAKVWNDVDASYAQLNESVDRITGDKMELLKRDIQMLMVDVENKLRKVIEKYDFNK